MVCCLDKMHKMRIFSFFHVEIFLGTIGKHPNYCNLLQQNYGFYDYEYYCVVASINITNIDFTGNLILEWQVNKDNNSHKNPCTQ